MKISEYMKKNVISIPASATVEEAADLFAHHHIGTLPVVDGQNKLVGVLHMRDLLDMIMPSFVRLIKDFDFVRGSFGLFENLRPSAEKAKCPINDIMTEPVYVHEDAGLLRVFAMLDADDMYDMPVVDDDLRLVGLASRVDIGTALLAGWHDDKEAG